MERYFGGNKTRVPQTSAEVNGRSIDSRKKNLGYILKFEKSDECYADLDSEIGENAKRVQQKGNSRTAKQNEEVIRYMSNLPSFLEKGKNVPERAFTVGVLDWRLLEKWQNSHNIGNGHSPSTSNTSSYSSTESSSRSSSSPACKKMDHPTLQSHLYASSDSELFQDLGDGPGGTSNFKKVTRNTRSKGSEDSKGKMKIQDFESLEKYDNLKASVDDISGQTCIGMHQKVVLAAPKIGIEDRCSSKPDTRQSQIEQPFSSDAKSSVFSSELNQRIPSCENNSVIPSRGQKLKEKTLITPLKNTVEIKPSEGSNSKTKVRNHSPIRRFSMSMMGKIGMISSSSVTESVEESSSNDKSKANGKRSSSPLRRLLDPLIKPKAVNSDRSTGVSLNDSTTRDRRGESAASLHSVKMKLQLKHCKKIDAEDPHYNKKDKSSTTVQALLQVTVKNGVPLYTFAVDNKSEILAATMKKDEYSWIYTFFFINDSKKKNKERGNGNGYVPNVVAQMRVADDLTKHNSTVKEFVLFATDRRQVANQKTTDLELNDELAAVIVKVAEKTISMTVIFPGGNHGVPIKGEPSSLIRRWKSGGSCDCGGWDLGCQLRVMANEKKGSQASNSTKPDLAERFELFHQGEEVDQKPVFSLSPFKDGIFSVEFDSSMKVLQAFSISLAVLRSETSNLFRNKVSEDVIESEGDKPKVCSRDQVEVPVKYVTHPPLSPVGRV